MIFRVVCCVALLGGSMAFGQAATSFDEPRFGGRNRPSPGDGLRAEAVEVKYINKVDVPAPSEGILMDLPIEEGNIVDEDQLLAMIDVRAAKLAVDLKSAAEKLARHKAMDDVNLRDAQNNKALADTEFQAFRKLNQEGAVPFFEMKRKELEAIKQGLRIELAEMEDTTRRIEVVIAQTELKMAQEQLDRGQVKAPTSGFIEERLANKGQWVQAGTPICTLIRMDKLRVEGKISGLTSPGQIVKGQAVEVRIDTSDEAQTTMQGQLGYVSMEMDVNGQHRVWVEVENSRNGDDWLIKPGMQAEIIVPAR